MSNKELKRLKQLLEQYNDEKFCGKDKPILELLEDITELQKTN